MFKKAKLKTTEDIAKERAEKRRLKEEAKQNKSASSEPTKVSKKKSDKGISKTKSISKTKGISNTQNLSNFSNFSSDSVADSEPVKQPESKPEPEPDIFTLDNKIDIVLENKLIKFSQELEEKLFSQIRQEFGLGTKVTEDLQVKFRNLNERFLKLNLPERTRAINSFDQAIEIMKNSTSNYAKVSYKKIKRTVELSGQTNLTKEEKAELRNSNYAFKIMQDLFNFLISEDLIK